MVQGTLLGKATLVIAQKASVHLFMRCTKTTLNVALLKSLGRAGQAKWFVSFLRICGFVPTVPGNERSVPGVPTVTVYGSLSHLGRAVTVRRGVW